MATVYLAQDIRYSRPVAVKVLHPELAPALGPERFLREIAVAARLQHSHLLPLYDSGAAGDLLYYVMPYVPGESLRKRLSREGQLHLDDALLALGGAYETADSLSVAVRTYREIPARFPASRLAPEAQKRIGDLYAGALGDWKQALVEYEALLTRWPQSLQAGEMRGTVLRLRRKNAS